MIRGRDILHLSLDDYWTGIPHSRHHLTDQFLKNGNRIFWVNSFGMRMPKLAKKGSVTKIANKLKSFLKYARKVDENFWVLSPLALPLQGSRTLSSMNDEFLLWQLQLLIRIYRIRNPVLFVTSPMFPGVIRRLCKDLVVYYYSDKYVSYREIVHTEQIKQLDAMTVSLADYIFCASKDIYQEVSKNSPNVFYLPHAVDFTHFNGILHVNTDVPKDMKDIKRPVIGYFGSLTDSNDIGLIRYIAEKRPHYSIVLIGRPSPVYEELSEIPNIHLLGRKDYRDIPLYGKYFDVCFMAWKMTEWIKNCSPLKTREYLAMGKPVVAVPIDELVAVYGDIIAVGRDRDDFLQKIDQSLRNDSAEKRDQRINFIRNDTWENRFRQMVEIMEKGNLCKS